MRSFKTAGDRGDILAALPAVRALGGGIIYIEAVHWTRDYLTPNRWCGIDRILRAQPYVADVREFRGEPIEFNLNDWRERLRIAMFKRQHLDKNLADWQLEQYGLNPDEKKQPWLAIEPKKIARVVFSRSGAGRPSHYTYHNPRFPWHYIWEKYRKDAVFVGTEDEHKIFCATCGTVGHVVTKDLYEAAQVISGCDLFVGNQSCPFWIAEGMKKRLVLEVWPNGPNCLTNRVGAVMGFDENVELPDL